MEWGKIRASQRSRQRAKPFLWSITHCINTLSVSGRKPSSVIAVTAWIFGMYSGLLIMTGSRKKIACNSHYFLVTALECLYGMYVTARYA